MLVTLVVHPSDAARRYPLAVIAQGSSGRNHPQAFRRHWLRTFAHDFAHHG